MYKIVLNRPMAPGSLISLSYTDSEGHDTTGRFISHPANVNGNGIAGPSEIIDLIDAINGIKPLPWGLYSGDLDRSGVIAPPDIMTLVDLLNGANGFGVWNGTALPDARECP